MKDKHILLAEDSLEGILSAVSYAYKSRCGHENNEIRIDEGEYQPELFAEYIHVPEDRTAAQNVYAAVVDKLGAGAAELVENASISYYADRAEAVYRFLVDGFRKGPAITDCHGIPSVSRIFDISRNISNETNHWIEFVRFTSRIIAGTEDAEVPDAGNMLPEGQRNVNELLSAVIAPKNRIMARIMPHFADRFPMEQFIIYDGIHDTAGIHFPQREWVLLQHADADNPGLSDFLREQNGYDKEMQELWKIFFNATDIPERKNLRTQNSFLPKWFRMNMTEFI